MRVVFSWRAKLRFLSFALLASLIMSMTAAAGTLSGPVLDEGATVELVDVVQLPATGGSPPLARIGHIREAPDASGRLFANDLNGPLQLIDGSTVSTYMDLRILAPKLMTNSLQWGFVGFAFHPDFASNGLLYTAHTESIGIATPNLEPPVSVPIIAHSVLTEWQATDPAADVFSGNSRELMRVAAPHRFHNFGEIGFDPGLTPADPEYGLLYIATGDFGSVLSGHPEQLQRLDSVYGCLLRIDPLGGPFLRNAISYPYGIPPTNPYADDGDDNTLGEIFVHGLRNPQNFHFDRGGAGTLFVTDIGQANFEEVNIVHPGANFGWPEREGNMALDVTVNSETVFALPAGDDSLGFSYPVAQYDHDEGFAIAGGLAVRSPVPSLLRDKFIFGDIVNGRLFYSDIDAMILDDDADPSTIAQVYELQLLRNGVETTLLDEIRAALGNNNISRTDLRFSADASGRLFVTTKQDAYIRELIPVPSGPTTTAAAPGGHRSVSNAPNPFNPRTEILLSLPQASRVRVSIYDLAGRQVRVLLENELDAGQHRYPWDGRNTAGEAVASGVYVYRVESSNGAVSGKMSLVR
jgi:hypothetical protein